MKHTSVVLSNELQKLTYSTFLPQIHAIKMMEMLSAKSNFKIKWCTKNTLLRKCLVRSQNITTLKQNGVQRTHSYQSNGRRSQTS